MFQWSIEELLTKLVAFQMVHFVTVSEARAFEVVLGHDHDMRRGYEQAVLERETESLSAMGTG